MKNAYLQKRFKIYTEFVKPEYGFETIESMYFSGSWYVEDLPIRFQLN